MILQVWDSCSDAAITFSPYDSPGFDILTGPTELLGSHDHHMTDQPVEEGDDMMGYVVENDVIIKALDDQVATSCSNVEIRRGTTLSSISEQDKPDEQVLMCVHFVKSPQTIVHCFFC